MASSSIAPVTVFHERPFRSARPFANASSNPAMSSRKLFMSSKVADVHMTTSKAPLSIADIDERAQFRVTAAQVEKIGAEQFDKKQRKAYDQKRVEALGGLAAKNIKTPINILKGMRNKGKERQSKQDAMDLAAGNAVKKRVKKVVVEDKGLKIGLGKYSRGRLHLSKSDIKTLETPDVKPRLSRMFRR